MYLCRRSLIWVLCFVLHFGGTGKLYAQDAAIQADSAGIISGIHADFIYAEDRKLFQDVYLELKSAAEPVFRLSCYRFAASGDSIKVYSNKYKAPKAGKGIAKICVPFQGPGTEASFHPAFFHILNQAGMVPAGHYKTYISVSTTTGGTVAGKCLLYEQDSLLTINSPLRRGITALVRPPGSGRFPVAAPAITTGALLDNATKAMERNRSRLERYFKKKGLSPRQYQAGGKEIIDLWYEDWYVGRYEIASGTSFSSQLHKEQEAMESNVGSLARNSLGNYPSLQSQFRELKKNSRENKELTGELALSGNFSNDQEPGSGQDNRYYEARGNLEFPLMDIPVSLSGYYTTQDRHREAKSSYIHFRYDAEKAKEQLMKLIGSYNNRYEQTIARGGNYSMVYGQFIQQLKTQKEQAIAALRQQAGLPAADLSVINKEQLEAALVNKIEQEKDKLEDSARNAVSHSTAGEQAAGTLQQAAAIKEKGTERYRKAMEQYERIQALEKKIQKYQALLEQYKNTSYYDSLLAYSKIKDLRNMDETSYKDMAKKASGLLPDGKAKGLIAGLTSFDAGMFPKYVSDYTQSGQMLKGIDLGYDIGFAEIGGGYGKTEYVDREGKVEGYKAYNARMQLKPVMGQKFGLVYYGYSPGSKLLSDNNFFRDVSVSLPSFRNPVHIFSATYSGTITRYVQASGEYALTQKQGQAQEAAAQSSLKEKSAYNFKLEGSIPATSLTIEAGYEHAGRNFENNTLPVILAGTDRYRISGKGDFFHAFLSLGVEYNYLVQSSFNARGTNSKWGFNLATHSKRYPSVSLSYKPFSTFRSLNDTLSVAQKPLLGEVWTGKVSYQIKRQARAIRFTLLCNRNNSTMDTVHYNSTLIQLNTILSYKTTMLSLNLGSTDVHTDYIELAYPAFNSSRFANLSASGTLFDVLMLSGGMDIATTRMGVSRYGCFVAPGYSFKQLPLMIRAGFRCSNYRLDEAAGWKQLYAGSIELAWRFKMKLFDY